MYRYVALASLGLVAIATAQGAGKEMEEVHPKLTAKKCTGSGSCTNIGGSVVLDSNWRWVHNSDGYENCYDGNAWVDEYCPDSATCTKNCVLEGVDYKKTYGISTSGDALTLTFVTEHEFGTNIGGRVYMMDGEDKYYMFKLKNQEFTFDVDVSGLPCGLNGALYFSEMAADGGPAEAGAKYGTGYCDAQCPHDIKFINGEANVEGWNPSDTDPNAGSGKYGTCCNEMDIWEANSISTAYTPHGCTKQGPYRCEGADCGDADNRYGGVCDKDGCDFNSYRLGVKDFYGPGMTVDTNKKFTVVTQFITDDGTANGKLVEIRRKYVQGGKVIENSSSTIAGIDGDSITEEFCDQTKEVFGDVNDFKAKGGYSPMDKAMSNGMVLVMSIWDDHAAHMLWLDSSYPLDKDPSEPGVARGTCPTDSGVPAEVEAASPDAKVIFSNIKVGDIDSTYDRKATRRGRAARNITKA